MCNQNSWGGCNSCWIIIAIIILLFFCGNGNGCGNGCGAAVQNGGCGTCC